MPSLGLGLGLTSASILEGGDAAASDPPSPAADHTTWWADDIDQADGTLIYTWVPRVDEIGIGALTQGTSDARPVFKTSAGPGGQPSVLFDGTEDVLPSAGFTAISQPITWFGVVQWLRTTGTNVLVSSSGTGANHIPIYERSTGWAYYAGTLQETAGGADTAEHYFEVTMDGGSSEMILDDTDITPAGSPGTNGLASVRMGALYDNSNKGWGYVSFLMVVDGSPSAGERAAIRSWVAARYGITTS